jgi:2-succinyl-5-enolpyruvyl-6-hydroxy-3-cyclohexene-1-carboxylate synthase
LRCRLLENLPLAEKCIQQLRAKGVKQFIVCAGARNAPLVVTLGDEAMHFFEERSAGFFALGRIKSLHDPVAVITTSGTAVGELLPAMMEAFHAQLPLVVVTADRPKLHRGSGSPQATEHVGIFSHFVEHTVDWDGENYKPLEHWHVKGPLHFNICFSEPLLSGGAR